MDCESCIWRQSCAADTQQLDTSECEYFAPIDDDFDEMVEVDGRWLSPGGALLFHITEELYD